MLAKRCVVPAGAASLAACMGVGREGFFAKRSHSVATYWPTLDCGGFRVFAPAVGATGGRERGGASRETAQNGCETRGNDHDDTTARREAAVFAGDGPAERISYCAAEAPAERPRSPEGGMKATLVIGNVEAAICDTGS